jgi:hypothetical protein
MPPLLPVTSATLSSSRRMGIALRRSWIVGIGVKASDAWNVLL